MLFSLRTCIKNFSVVLQRMHNEVEIPPILSEYFDESGILRTFIISLIGLRQVDIYEWFLLEAYLTFQWPKFIVIFLVINFSYLTVRPEMIMFFFYIGDICFPVPTLQTLKLYGKSSV